MKVFLPIPCHELSSCVPRAFAERGHETRVFDWQSRLRAVGRERMEREMIASARAFGPHLAFCQFQAPNIISPAFPTALREIGCFTVNWSGDVRAPLPQWYLGAAASFDVTSFTNWPDITAIRAAGHRAEFLQVGYDDRLYHPPDRDAERRGAVFIGNNWLTFYPEGRNRIRMVQSLAAALGSEFRVYGQSWSGLVPGRSVGGSVVQPADAAVYRAARVAVGWEHFRRAGFASDRLLRATACGCVVVQSRYEGIAEEHPHVVAVDTVEELVHATRKALRDGDDSTGASTARHTLSQHTWPRRVEQIERWMR